MEVKGHVISPIVAMDGSSITREAVQKVDPHNLYVRPSNEEKTVEIPKGEWTFEKQHGFSPLRAVGPYIAVEIYKHKLSETIAIQDSVTNMQKWTSNVGRVFSIGSACYKGDRFKDWDELPEIGDWVVFKVNAGPVFKYRGIDVAIMFDDAVNGITEEPSYVSRD
jgi:hypothetical protein